MSKLQSDSTIRAICIPWYSQRITPKGHCKYPNQGELFRARFSLYKLPWSAGWCVAALSQEQNREEILILRITISSPCSKWKVICYRSIPPVEDSSPCCISAGGGEASKGFTHSVYCTPLTPPMLCYTIFHTGELHITTMLWYALLQYATVHTGEFYPMSQTLERNLWHISHVAHEHNCITFLDRFISHPVWA